MSIQIPQARTFIKRTKREITFFYPGKLPPKGPSRVQPVVRADRDTAPPAPRPFATKSGLAEAVVTPPSAASLSQAGNAAEFGCDSSSIVCNACGAQTSAAPAEIARLPSLIAELAALADTIRPLAYAVHTVAAPPTPKPKRKYTRRKTEQKVEPLPLQERRWVTFKQAAAIYPKSEQALRHLAHQSGQYLKHPKAGLSSNGFEKCIARQPGSRNVYLIVEELDRWMAQGQEGAQ